MRSPSSLLNYLGGLHKIVLKFLDFVPISFLMNAQLRLQSNLDCFYS